MSKPEDRNTYGSIDEFRQAARDIDADAFGEPPRIRASFDTDVKAGEGESRTLMFTISSKSVDRMGDTIDVAGWKMDAFRKNPVVLWAHDSSMLPVGKAPKVWIEGDKLKADAEFTPKGLANFNDVVFEMYKQGFLSATSVGFLPLKYAFAEDPGRKFGIDFIEQELLEFSAVPVPANSEALIESRSAGIDIAPILDWAEEQIKRCFDNERIMKLAENVLGGEGDTQLLPWAERIITANGKKIAAPDQVVVSRSRIEKIELAARNKRLTEKRQRDLELIRMRSV